MESKAWCPQFKGLFNEGIHVLHSLCGNQKLPVPSSNDCLMRETKNLN